MNLRRFVVALILLVVFAAPALAASPCALSFPFANVPVNTNLQTLKDCANGIYNRANPTQTAGGTANALTLTYSPAVTAYTAGDGYTFIAGNTNTGAATLNINGLGVVPILFETATLTAGEIVAGRIVSVYYDGANFQLIGDTALATPLILPNGAYSSPGCFLCGAAAPLTVGSGVGNTYSTIDSGPIGDGSDSSVVLRKGTIPVGEMGVVTDLGVHIKTVESALFTGSLSGTTLTVSAISSGTIAAGALLLDSNPPFLYGGGNIVGSPVIQAYGTGGTTGTGGTGTYAISGGAQTVTSETMASYLFSDRLIAHGDYPSENLSGYTDLLNSKGVRLQYNGLAGSPSINYFSLGSVDAAGTSGEGMWLGYDLGSDNGFFTCVAYGNAWEPCIFQTQDFRVSTGTVNLNNAAFEVTVDAATTAGHPIRRAASALIGNTGAGSIATEQGYVPNSTIVTPCTTASKFCVQQGVAPTYLVSATLLSNVLGIASAGSGGSNSVATTTSAVAVAGQTSLSVASIAGISNSDPIFVKCGGGSANDPPFYTGTVNGAPSGSTVNITPALACHVASGNQVVDKYAVLTGTTGTGTFAQVLGQISSGALAAYLGVLNYGSYTVNPANLAAEPFSGGGFSVNPTLHITMGVAALALASAGAVGASSQFTYPQSPTPTTSSDSSSGVTIAITFADQLASNSAQGIWVDGALRAPPAVAVASPQVVFVGDSLTADSARTEPVPNGAHPYDHYINLPAYRGLSWSDINIGVGGRTLATMYAQAPNNFYPLFLPAGGANVAIIWGGTNDLAGGTAPASLYATATSFIQQAQSKGWKVCIGTIISRTGSFGGNALDTLATTYNASVTGNAAGADCVVDFAANSHLSPNGSNYSNTTYYQADGIHLTPAGYVLAAGVAQTALTTLIGGLPGGNTVVGQVGGYFYSVGANDNEVSFDVKTAGRQAFLTFLDGGTRKWSVGKFTNNNFYVYDWPNNVYPLVIDTSDNINFAAGIQSGGTPGVTCGSINAATVTTKNGLVTHC